MDVNGRRSYVAEGGESCLTSGDRREPEGNGILFLFLFLSLGKAEREEEVFIICINILGFPTVTRG